MALTCKFCGDPVDKKSGFRRVSGWERIERPGGGTNAIAQREPTEEFSCRACLDKLARGISPEQGSLL